VVANGEVIASVDGVADDAGYLRAAVDVDAPAGWVVARWGGAVGFAHSSPVAVGAPRRDADAVAALVALINETREWAERHGRYANPKHREQLLARCSMAIARLHSAA
jgi:hypothetical protein